MVNLAYLAGGLLAVLLIGGAVIAFYLFITVIAADMMEML
jgi:hypothetical protein